MLPTRPGVSRNSYQYSNTYWGNFCVKRRVSTGYRQAKPYTLPLPYYDYQVTSAVVAVNAAKFGGNYGAENGVIPSQLYAIETERARNAAYEKMKDKLYSTASVGASLAEYRQSLQMVTNRSEQLLTLAFRIAKRDFKGALSVVKSAGISSKSRKFKTEKSFSNNWLEFVFGWEPMIQDIYDAAHVMQAPFERTRATGGSSETINFRQDNLSPGVLDIKVRRYGEVSCRMGVSMTIENPGLHLADQLGVLNPLTVAWELAPFSFVVDWFTTAGTWLSSLSDFAGTTLTDGFTTDQYRLTEENTWVDYPYGDSRILIDRVDRQYVETQRSTGITYPSLRAKSISLPSAKRATTQIALLTQFLGNNR